MLSAPKQILTSLKNLKEWWIITGILRNGNTAEIFFVIVRLTRARGIGKNRLARYSHLDSGPVIEVSQKIRGLVEEAMGVG